MCFLGENGGNLNGSPLRISRLYFNVYIFKLKTCSIVIVPTIEHFLSIFVFHFLYHKHKRHY